MATLEDFDQAVAVRIQQGWRIESQANKIAMMVKGKKTNHILHLLLSMMTFGLWVLIWINVASWGGERRLNIKLEPDGTLMETRQRPGAFKSWPPKKTILS